MSYCLNSCWNFTVGGKVGLYANDARLKHRVGTETELAYINGNPTDDIYTDSSDTSLATLGELDFGLGYRIGCAWTISEAIGCLAWLVLPLPSTRFHRAIQRSPQVERSTLTTATFCRWLFRVGMQLVDGVLIDHPKEFPVRSDFTVSWQ